MIALCLFFLCFAPNHVDVNFYNLPHSFYFSITQIDHNPKAETLEVSMKVFIDDLEEALETNFNQKTHLGSAKELCKTDSLIHLYLKQNFYIEVNEQTVEQRFLGREIEEDAIWCYIEIPNCPSVQSIKVTNHVFVDLFDRQQNVVHLKVGQQKKSLILNQDRTEGLVEFAQP